MMKQAIKNPVRGLYLRNGEGPWTLEKSGSIRRPYRDQHILPSTFTFNGGALIPDHPAYPARIRLGAGPLTSLGVGHFVHILHGAPLKGTLYVYHRGESVVIQVTPDGSDVSEPRNIGRRLHELVAEWDERAARNLQTLPFPASVPLSDDLPALYADFAR